MQNVEHGVVPHGRKPAPLSKPPPDDEDEVSAQDVLKALRKVMRGKGHQSDSDSESGEGAG
eukprot:4090882-Karenia_brevis.AAC.1